MSGPVFPSSPRVALVSPTADANRDEYRSEADVAPPTMFEKRYPGIFLRPFRQAMVEGGYSVISMRDYCRNVRLLLGALGWQRDPTLDDSIALTAITVDDVNGAISHSFSSSQKGKAKTSWNLYAGWCMRTFGCAVARVGEKRIRPSLGDMPETGVGRPPRAALRDDDE